LRREERCRRVRCDRRQQAIAAVRDIADEAPNFQRMTASSSRGIMGSTKGETMAEHEELKRAGKAFGTSLIFFWLRFGAALALFAFVVAIVLLGSLPIVAFIAFIVFALVEMACCTWVIGHWDEWEASAGAKIREEVDGWRDGRIMRRVVDGVSRDSATWYSVAAALAGSVDALTAAHLLSGRLVAKRRVIWSCVVRGAVLTVLVVLTALLVGPGGTRF
jgi:F0F1-type ATP synthase membrane subunit c/vacuolar-type H+-ATPase subunit K